MGMVQPAAASAAAARRRLSACRSHLVGGASAAEAEPINKQAPGAKTQGDHASNQSVTATVTATVTDIQRFQMDTRGWLVLPGILSPAECDAIKAHLYQGGDTYSGPCVQLLDHPALVAVLNEFLVERDLSDEFYNFRCESSFATIRSAGFKAGGTDVAHTVRPPQRANAMRYHAVGGRIYTGLTRCVWELNPVAKTDGGTKFLTGSHKAHFECPDAMVAPHNEFMDSYECPAGSCVIFTESLYHAAVDWDNEEYDRVAVFNCYNSLWAQWHKTNLSHEQIMAMPTKCRTLFRGVYAHDFSGGGDNIEFSEANMAL
jgi:hypothetical protein